MPPKLIEFKDYQLPDNTPPRLKAKRVHDFENDYLEDFVRVTTMTLGEYADGAQKAIKPLLKHTNIYHDITSYQEDFGKSKKYKEVYDEYHRYIASEWEMFRKVTELSQQLNSSLYNVPLETFPNKPPVVITVFYDFTGYYYSAGRVQYDYENLVLHFTSGFSDYSKAYFASRDLFIAFVQTVNNFRSDIKQLNPILKKASRDTPF